MKVYAVTNQKGGVGKTTTAVNLTASLRARKKSVLLVDFDPQGNATSGMGVAKNSSPNVYDALLGQAPAGKAVVRGTYGDVIPTGMALSAAELELADMPEREYCLRRAIEPLRDKYEYILIDCPPSLGLLTLNAICAADELLIPVQCEYYALEGLSDLTRTLKLLRGGLHPRVEIGGVLLTMFDSRTNLSLQVAAEVKRFFPGKVFKTSIPRTVRLSEAPSHGLPIIGYDRASRGCDAYIEAADELIARAGRANP